VRLKKQWCLEWGLEGSQEGKIFFTSASMGTIFEKKSSPETTEPKKKFK
jgi:hypothetical protein